LPATIIGIGQHVVSLLDGQTNENSCWEFIDFIPKYLETVAKTQRQSDKDVIIKKLLESEWHPLSAAKFASVFREIELTQQQHGIALEKVAS